jgi:hypothetical protein
MASKSGTVYIEQPRKTKGQSGTDLNEIKLDELAFRSEFVIYEVSSKSSLFNPKITLTICPNRVAITKRSFFSREEYPMLIDSITNSRIFTHFGRATIYIDTFGIEKPEPLSNMKIDEARLARRYILALIECKKSNINLSNMNLYELRQKLKSIGTVRYSTSEKDYHNI